MAQVTTIGLDIAKSVFQIHGVSATGEVVVQRRLRRTGLAAFFATLPPCLVGLEACATSHHWARVLSDLGHDVRLMPAAYVKPYVKRQKNDMTDAAAICEAVTRPIVRFVPVKSDEQHSVLSLHRARDLEAAIRAWHRSNPTSRRLATIPAIGPITASALAASIADLRKSAAPAPVGPHRYGWSVTLREMLSCSTRYTDSRIRGQSNERDSAPLGPPPIHATVPFADGFPIPARPFPAQCIVQCALGSFGCAGLAGISLSPLSNPVPPTARLSDDER